MATLISQVGFPIVVALILLYQVDRMHRQNQASLENLTLAVNGLTKVIEAYFGRG